MRAAKSSSRAPVSPHSTGRVCWLCALPHADRLLISAAFSSLDSERNPCWAPLAVGLPASLLLLLLLRKPPFWTPCRPATSPPCPLRDARSRPRLALPVISAAAVAATASSAVCDHCSIGGDREALTAGHDRSFASVFGREVSVPVRTYGASLLAWAAGMSRALRAADTALPSLHADDGRGVSRRARGALSAALACGELGGLGSVGREVVPRSGAASVSSTALRRFSRPLKRPRAGLLDRAAWADDDGGDTHDRAVALLCLRRMRARAACAMLRTPSRMRSRLPRVSTVAAAVALMSLPFAESGLTRTLRPRPDSGRIASGSHEGGALRQAMRRACAAPAAKRARTCAESLPVSDPCEAHLRMS